MHFIISVAESHCRKIRFENKTFSRRNSFLISQNFVDAMLEIKIVISYFRVQNSNFECFPWSVDFSFLFINTILVVLFRLMFCMFFLIPMSVFLLSLSDTSLSPPLFPTPCQLRSNPSLVSVPPRGKVETSIQSPI